MGQHGTTDSPYRGNGYLDRRATRSARGCTRPRHDAPMSRFRLLLMFAVVGGLSGALCRAQFPRGDRRQPWGGETGPMVRTEGGQWVNEETVRTARETLPQVTTTPNWTNGVGFEQSTFTFARIQFKSPGRPAVMGWINDYPDSDLNLSFRLQQLTSLKVDPDGRVVKLTDPRLASYPFIFAAHPGAMELTDDEVAAMRKYLLNGGVFMADDFWGSREWDTFEGQMKRVLPGKAWVELPFEHPLFHCIFDLKGGMSTLQIPSIHFWRRNRDSANPRAGVSRSRGPGSDEMHVRAWLDDHGRIMIIAMHNSDDGDGWEREGEDEEYFHQFSEARAYPLAINLVFYLMTH